MAALDINLQFEGEHADRMKALKERTHAENWQKLWAVMAQYYEALVNKASAVENRGGKLFLLVEFPDGSSEKEPMFGEEDGRPALLS